MHDPTKPYKKQILDMIKQTWETPYVSVTDGIVREKLPYMDKYHHADGIGTKGVYHWRQRTFKNAVIDAMNQNHNDLAVERVTPYAAIDELVLPHEDGEAILETVNHLVYECRERNIAITGGETEFDDTLNEIKLCITMLGFVKNKKTNRFKKGDALVGLASSGLHSNGFSTVRRVFGKKYRPEFTEPTALYYDAVMQLCEEFDVHGMVHVTGGAYTKLRDLLENLDARIHRIQPHQIFFELYERGVSDEDMYKIFNCGVGFILSVPERDAGKVVAKFNGFRADVIGEISEGAGKIEIESAFSGKKVTL